ncbi:MAG: hypothetical protein M3X11_20195, partial [Acidobacteriota bacterium]|nr:hypothetical protein [Acidobacteriota bacterium]
ANTVTSPITLASELVINKNLTIQGPGANALTVSGNNVTRIFYLLATTVVTIDGLKITQGNGVGAVSSGSGGGIFNDQGNLTLTNSTVTGNTANGGGSGGGINNLNGTLAISRSTISNNTTSYYGSGIFNNGNAPAVLTLTDSTVRDNSTGGFRGGAIVNVAGQATVTNSAVFDNTSTGQGAGGLWNWIGGTLTLINSTVSGNTGNGYSGGILNDGSTLTLTNCTVFGNRDIDSSSAFVAGGVGNTGGGTVTIKNTIVSNNTIGANNSNSDCAGAITSQGFNLIQTTSGATITPAQPTDIFGVGPLLG